MDTILTDEASLLSSGSLPHPKARLPGENVFDMLRHTPEQEPLPQVPQERFHHVSRKTLLGAAGLFVILGTIVSVGYVERARFAHLPLLHRDVTAQPRSHVKPAIAGNDVTLPPPIHPQAAVAVPPVRALVDKVAPAPAKPAPGLQQPVGNGQSIAGPATGKPSIAPPKPNAQTDMREFTTLQAKTPAPPTAINPTVPQPDAPPGEAGKPTPTAAPGQTETPLAPAAGAAVPPAEQHTAVSHAPPQAAKPAPVDPVAEATSLRPGPMTPHEQIDVLNLMEKLGIVVRDLRDENAQLRTAVKNLSEEVDTRTTQLDRRLSLAEAKGAIAAAMGAGQTPAQSATVLVTAQAPTAAKAPAASPAPAAPPPLVRSVKDYHIQAASPGLAMLSSVGLSDGDTASIQVAVGDEVPGVGRIKAIFQKGTNWVVETDHGLIE
jgi:hypothetical protein